MSHRSRAREIAIAAFTLLLSPAFGQDNYDRSAAPAPGVTRQLELPVILRGRVMLEDGTAAPPSVAIEIVCLNRSLVEGYTDFEGYFSVRLDRGDNVTGNASEAGSNLELPAGGTPDAVTTRYSNCDLQARLGGYRSQTVSMASYDAMGGQDIGVILLHHIAPTEPATVTATALQAPKEARKDLDKATALVAKHKPEEAMASIRQAVTVDPRFAFAWCQLGRLQAAAGKPDEARQSFEAAAQAEPRWPAPLMDLSLLAFQAQDWPALNGFTNQLLSLNSFDYPQAYILNAVAHYKLGQLEAAEKSARSAARLDVRHQYPQINHVLGAILIERRQYSEAADVLNSYLVESPQARDAAQIRKQLDDIERLGLLEAGAR